MHFFGNDRFTFSYRAGQIFNFCSQLIHIVIQAGKFLGIYIEKPFFFFLILILGSGFYGFHFTHFCGKIKFLFHVWLHRLIVLVLFSVSSLTNDRQHERICVPIVSRLRPCLSTEDRFVNLRHLHRLLHWEYLSVRQI